MSELNFHGCRYAPAGKPDPAAHQAALKTIVGFLKPKPCKHELLRVGPAGDGGYLMPDDLQGVTACFSPGVFNIKYFEDDLARRFGIPSHMCDYSSDLAQLATPLMPGQTFRKLWLDRPGTPDSIDLDTWVRECAPGTGDLVIQMDIEGAEYRNLLTCSDETLSRFRIIVLELHDLHKLLDPDITLDVLGPFFAKLARHFTCVHAHPNNVGGDVILPEFGVNMPLLMEITLYRTDRMSGAGAGELRPVLLPHPDDVARNVTNAPPLFLNSHWFDGPRPVASQLKMMSDENAWMRETFQEAIEQQRQALARTAVGLFQMMASSAPPATEGHGPVEEVAAGKPYRLSSSFASSVVDGVVVENATSFFFHTALETNPSIRVDLGEPRVLRRLTVRNRLDACFDRAGILFVLLHIAPDTRDAIAIPIPTPAAFLNGSAPETAADLRGVRARYVTIFSPLAPTLHFSRLQVFADCASESFQPATFAAAE